MTDSILVDVTRGSSDVEEDSLRILSAISDPVRWSVLRRLSRQAECVCNLQEALEVAPNLLSYHLKVLRDAGLVTATRRGRWMDYALAPGLYDILIGALPVTDVRHVAPCADTDGTERSVNC
ncbi:ArsR/SmtB family transcription factor [Flaviflexus huanghaiensis]|uniref:ArsR/SmtB family transcription factor n=1 Tax=Flaviflexus huanghaiensis TaxID=1111473 RepID=UPI0015FE51EF|nr:metalloregulator ArsR/SmtB family transcription factor [Flaviflexus huanghaiensis]